LTATAPKLGSGTGKNKTDGLVFTKQPVKKPAKVDMAGSLKPDSPIAGPVDPKQVIPFQEDGFADF
jgi:hypothetical protein